MGLIDHVSRFNAKRGYREGWILSTRFEKSLGQLTEMVAGFKDAAVGSQDKDMLVLQLAQARRDAAKSARENGDHDESSNGSKGDMNEIE